MGNLAATDLYALALSAGFPSDTAVKMVAIALKESGGNPLAHNTVPPDDSYGLWQINMYGNLGPARVAQFGLLSPSDLFDPATNAAAAFQIWGFNDNNLQIGWAINDGGVNQSRYQSYLPVAMQAAQLYAQSGGGITGGGGVTATGSPPFPSGLSPAPVFRPSSILPASQPSGARFRRLQSWALRSWAALSSLKLFSRRGRP